jgi:hypothetical protein
MYSNTPDIDIDKLKTPLDPLHFLIGSWETEGIVLADGEDRATTIKGTDVYELVLGGHFILHQADVVMDNKRVAVFEMIGEYDPIEQTWQMRSFDNQGSFATMHATMSEGHLQIIGEKMRARLSKADDGSYMIANWEKSEDGQSWEPWMEIKFTR